MGLRAVCDGATSWPLNGLPMKHGPVPVASGVTWSRLRTASLYGGDQTLNLIELDPTAVELHPENHGGCDEVEDVGASIGAFAGVNGGFYSSCTTTDLFRSDGVTDTTSSTTGYEQRAAGWNAYGSLDLSWIAASTDWTTYDNAMAGYPSLVESSVALAEVYDGQEVWSSTDWSDNPRTALGVASDGTVMLLTVDGRTVGRWHPTQEFGQSHAPRVRWMPSIGWGRIDDHVERLLAQWGGLPIRQWRRGPRWVPSCRHGIYLR